MPLNENERALLVPAVLAGRTTWDGYDLEARAEVPFGSFAAFERGVREDLCSMDPELVKRGMVNCFYWGMQGGNRAHLMGPFNELCNFHSPEKFLMAAVLFQMLVADMPGTAYLHMIKGLDIPGYSGMAFVSKLRMFLDPGRWVVLDRRLLVGLRNPPGAAIYNVLDAVKFVPPPEGHDTTIAIDDVNEGGYRRWALLCRQIAADHAFEGHQVHRREVLAADVERGFYNLLPDGHAEALRAIVNRLAPL